MNLFMTLMQRQVNLSLKATLGTVRYAHGQIAKNSKQNVKISTPTATVCC